jgi:hypothetical protein
MIFPKDEQPSFTAVQSNMGFNVYFYIILRTYSSRSLGIKMLIIRLCQDKEFVEKKEVTLEYDCRLHTQDTMGNSRGQKNKLNI